MSSPGELAAFLVASLLFIQVPGPSLLFTIGRALSVGRRDALLSVVGNALGLLGQVLGVAFGLGALVARSAEAFTVLKLVGASYVVYLGVQAVRHRGDARRSLEQQDDVRSTGAWRAVRTGLVVGLTNPKTIVLALAASRARDWFARKPRRLDRLGAAGGVMMIGLGAVLATSSSS